MDAARFWGMLTAALWVSSCGTLVCWASTGRDPFAGAYVLGLIVRLALLLAVVFGIAYGITRALRQSAHSAAAKRIQSDVRALKQGLEAGLYTVQEYRDLADRIRVACEKEGIEVPDLPQYEEPCSWRES